MFENKFEQSSVASEKDAARENNNIEKKKNTAQMTRRGFLKMVAIFGAGVVVGDKMDVLKKYIDTGKDKTEPAEFIENDQFQDVEDDFWLSVIEDVSREVGQELTPQDVRAHLITKLFNIPQGWTSGLATKKVKKTDGTIEQKRIAPELDKLIATCFTNKSIVVTESDNGLVISTDFRDFRDIGNKLQLFREELEHLRDGKEMGLHIYTILKKEYEHLQDIYKENRNIDFDEIPLQSRDNSVEFSYLPGGVPVFLRGYDHGKKWQPVHGDHLADTYKNVGYIAIESSGVPIGERLEDQWSHSDEQDGSYGQLMRGLVANGFDGLFFDIDARNETKVLFDSYFDKESKFQQVRSLPDAFYEHYFAYLQKENPRLTRKIGNLEKFKKILLSQTTIKFFVRGADLEFASKAKCYDATLGVSDNLEATTLPTGNEFGQMAFADAFAALKLHILAQNMSDGRIKKSIIVDFEGSHHVSMKSFYLKYPQYAAEIVLRTIHELMAGYAGKDLSWEDKKIGKNDPNNLREAQRMLDNPDWHGIIAEIGRVPMAYVENDPQKTVDVGPNQKKMKKYNILDQNILESLDTSVVWALFDDKYIQSHIDGTKSYTHKSKKKSGLIWKNSDKKGIL